MNERRPYSMTRRSEGAERTRARIVDATIGLALTRPLAQCTLPDIAEQAGVSVQTILRGFGSRDGLFQAAVAASRADVLAEREVSIDDVDASLRAIVDHYERMGDGMLLLIGQEQSEPLAAEITQVGKAVHRAWAERLFEQSLAQLPTHDRERAVDLLMAATDLFAWKLWRRDAGRTVPETVDRFRFLVRAVLGELTASQQQDRSRHAAHG